MYEFFELDVIFFVLYAMIFTRLTLSTHRYRCRLFFKMSLF